MTSAEETKLKLAMLKYQRDRLIQKYERVKATEAFIKKRLTKIMSLKMDGWPRLKEMPDRVKWIKLVYEAKIAGVYGIGTSNCDVVAQLHRFAKQISSTKNNDK